MNEPSVEMEQLDDFDPVLTTCDLMDGISDDEESDSDESLPSLDSFEDDEEDELFNDISLPKVDSPAPKKVVQLTG